MGKLKGRTDDPPITAQHPSIHSINHSIKGLSLDANQFCIECTFPAFQAIGGGRAKGGQAWTTTTKRCSDWLKAAPVYPSLPLLHSPLSLSQAESLSHGYTRSLTPPSRSAGNFTASELCRPQKHLRANNHPTTIHPSVRGPSLVHSPPPQAKNGKPSPENRKCSRQPQTEVLLCTFLWTIVGCKYAGRPPRHV